MTKTKEQAIKYLKEHMDTLIEYDKKIKAEEGASSTPTEAVRTPERPNPDMRIRTGMIVTDASSEKYYLKIGTPPALSVLINSTIEDIQNERETMDPITNLPFLDTSKDEKLAYLRKELEKAKLAESRGAKPDERKTPVKIFRLSNRELIEIKSKGNMWNDWNENNPKYIRNPLEREVFRMPDGNVYILQTFFDESDGKETVKFYVSRKDAGDKDVKRLAMTMEEFKELLDNGEITHADGFHPPTYTSEATPSTKPETNESRE